MLFCIVKKINFVEKIKQMKNKIFFINLVLLAVLISCKNNEEVKQVDEEIIEVKANTFDVIVDLNAAKDDELILFYKDASISYFDEKNTVYYGLKGNSESQTVTFSIPEGIYPNDIRLDISSKENQEPIKINSITFSFEGRTFKIEQKDILKYFTPNEYINFDETTGTVNFIKKESGFDPFFLTKPAIYAEIEKVGGVKL